MAGEAKQKETKPKIRILLADDQYISREGIRHILQGHREFQVVGEADNGEQAVRLARELKPDVIIMDARLRRLDGVEVTRQIEHEYPQIAIIVFTACDEEEYIVSLIGAGVASYLFKSTKDEQLLQAIRSVLAGHFVSNPEVVHKLYKRATRRAVTVSSAEHLTHRELQILKLAARGKSNQEIAHELGVSVRTVKGYFESIFSKMGVKSRTEAVLEALRRGWVSLQDN